MKYSLKMLIIIMFSISVLYGEGKEKSQKIVTTEKSISDNKEYTVIIGYEKWCGEGKAHYTIKNKEGKIISKFIAERAPSYVLVSNNGKNLIAFTGKWYEVLSLNGIIFYNFKGNIIKEYELNVHNLLLWPTLRAIKFTKDGNILVMGFGFDVKEYLRHKKIVRKNVLVFFDVPTGNIIRQFPVKEIYTPMSTSIALSNNAEWILIAGDEKLSALSEAIVLLDKNGKKYWEEPRARRNMGGMYRSLYISPDGKFFEYEKSNKRYIYRNANGKVTLKKVIEVNKDTEKGGK